MISTLINAYVQDTPTDCQGACVEAFFDDTDWWKENFDFVPTTGSDEETVMMIDMFLSNMSEVPAHIVKMLKDWKEHGF